MSQILAKICGLSNKCWSWALFIFDLALALGILIISVLASAEPGYPKFGYFVAGIGAATIVGLIGKATIAACNKDWPSAFGWVAVTHVAFATNYVFALIEFALIAGDGKAGGQIIAGMVVAVIGILEKAVCIYLIYRASEKNNETNVAIELEEVTTKLATV